jgi:hypothetical protein
VCLCILSYGPPLNHSVSLMSPADRCAPSQWDLNYKQQNFCLPCRFHVTNAVFLFRTKKWKTIQLWGIEKINCVKPYTNKSFHRFCAYIHTHTHTHEPRGSYPFNLVIIFSQSVQCMKSLNISLISVHYISLWFQISDYSISRSLQTFQRCLPPPETSVNFYQTTRRNNRKDSHLRK